MWILLRYTPETRFSELLDLMNKLQLTFFIFYSLSRLDLVNRLNLVNKKGLTITFTKSSLGCTYILYYIPTSIKIILSVQTPNLPLHLILLLPAGQLTFLLLMSFNSVILPLMDYPRPPFKNEISLFLYKSPHSANIGWPKV